MSEKENKFPSTARIERGHPDADRNGEYVPCPLNNHSFYHNRGAKHDLGQLTHPNAGIGYCKKHLTLGCTDRECIEQTQRDSSANR